MIKPMIETVDDVRAIDRTIGQPDNGQYLDDIERLTLLIVSNRSNIKDAARIVASIVLTDIGKQKGLHAVTQQMMRMSLTSLELYMMTMTAENTSQDLSVAVYDCIRETTAVLVP